MLSEVHNETEAAGVRKLEIRNLKCQPQAANPAEPESLGSQGHGSSTHDDSEEVMAPVPTMTRRRPCRTRLSLPRAAANRDRTEPPGDHAPRPH